MDVVVVGAGTAGCVVAARLSAAARHHVTLVEAGPDHPTPAELPVDVVDASRPTVDHDWGFTAEGDDGRPGTALPRARLVGGCSATNAVFFLRGWPADYDAWAAAGNPGWSYHDVLPILRGIEADADFGGPEHGGDGPVPVSRIAIEDLPPWPRDFHEAAVACGHRAVTDHNAPGTVGMGPLPRNVRGGTRMSTALTHLAPARGRLDVRADTTVDRIVHRGGQVRGVRLLEGDEVAADVVVLCAGTYGTPSVLLRSGIGPRADLEELGLRCAVALPGVGANLVDHPLVALDLPATPGQTGPAFPVLLSLRSTAASAETPPDLHLFPAGPFDDPGSRSGATFAILTGLLAPRSRGRVRLRSTDPEDPPRIDPAHLREPEDLVRMLAGLREARRIASTPPLADRLPGPEIHPGPAVDDDDALAGWLRRNVGSYHHPVGTCAMGRDPASGAVVDRHGAVHGLENLYVADASVMPTIPSANTNLTTVVIAERLAGHLVDHLEEDLPGRSAP
ncbi:GMC family oxidoreductase [Actinomycetospora sp. TBRC 11914]|uniref:GMC family oxidoreductase n=1 Tax=Actinomycetospora sp. TBRC 11914 TaxID=2729387 RepID=UPI00145FB032|nr:GMC oxidoreductase [Actinomycetospora sp. TBRC 11914]NMO90365.1 NAD(P)-binding protein [Actinomycetospora sp. TBRC 11914]